MHRPGVPSSLCTFLCNHASLPVTPGFAPSEAKVNLHPYGKRRRRGPIYGHQIAEEPAVSCPFSAKVPRVMRCKLI
ncbi:hypothetical protein ZWY2020_024619 [Hordeum vulgare]|nr:hypothetical protein ZWY2020_024619 [Hordeum vulgare]